VPTLETPMSPGGSQASAGEGLSPCNIGIGIGNECTPTLCRQRLPQLSHQKPLTMAAPLPLMQQTVVCLCVVLTCGVQTEVCLCVVLTCVQVLRDTSCGDVWKLQLLELLLQDWLLLPQQAVQLINVFGRCVRHCWRACFCLIPPSMQCCAKQWWHTRLSHQLALNTAAVSFTT